LDILSIYALLFLTFSMFVGFGLPFLLYTECGY